MRHFESLIGLPPEQAEQALLSAGFDDIEISVIKPLRDLYGRRRTGLRVLTVRGLGRTGCRIICAEFLLPPRADQAAFSAEG